MKRKFSRTPTAYEKREKTLGKEYARRNKTGGLYTSSRQRNLSRDERRQTVLDAKEANPQSLVLTHKGVPLKDLQRNAPVINEDDNGVIEADIVNELHFGGGLLSTQNGDKPLSFKDKMHDLIQRSKQKKAGHQLHQEEVHANVMRADEGWQETMQKVSAVFSNAAGSQFKQRMRDESLKRRRQAMMEMDSVVGLLQTSGVSSSGGHIIEKGDATPNNRGLDRLSQYLDTKAEDDSADEYDNESDAEDEEIHQEASVIPKKSQHFLEVLNHMNIIVQMEEEKRIQALTCLCHNLAPPIRSFYRLVGGLLITHSIAEATLDMGKYSSEINRFLAIALNLSVPQSERYKDYCMPPSTTPSFLKVANKSSTDFVWDEEQTVSTLKSFIAAEDTSATDDTCLHCLALTLSLVEKMICACQKTFPRCAPEVLRPIKHRLALLPKDNYPSVLKKRTEKILNMMEETLETTRVRPAMQWTEPQHKEIEMVDPIFGEELIARKRASKANIRGPLTANEKTRLLQKKVKAERKAAMRELRRDTEYLTSIKRKEQAQKDEDRKKKVARIMGDLAMQEGDYRKLVKK